MVGTLLESSYFVSPTPSSDRRLPAKLRRYQRRVSASKVISKLGVPMMSEPTVVDVRLDKLKEGRMADGNSMVGQQVIYDTGPAECVVCGTGDLVYTGRLSNTIWARCRNCGADIGVTEYTERVLNIQDENKHRMAEEVVASSTRTAPPALPVLTKGSPTTTRTAPSANPLCEP